MRLFLGATVQLLMVHVVADTYSIRDILLCITFPIRDGDGDGDADTNRVVMSTSCARTWWKADVRWKMGSC